jgi:hypothetical protein
MKDNQGDPVTCRTCVHSDPDQAAMARHLGKWQGKCRYFQPNVLGVPMQVQNGELVCSAFTNWAAVNEMSLSLRRASCAT